MSFYRGRCSTLTSVDLSGSRSWTFAVGLRFENLSWVRATDLAWKLWTESFCIRPHPGWRASWRLPTWQRCGTGHPFCYLPGGVSTKSLVLRQGAAARCTYSQAIRELGASVLFLCCMHMQQDLCSPAHYLFCFHFCRSFVKSPDRRGRLNSSMRSATRVSGLGPDGRSATAALRLPQIASAAEPKERNCTPVDKEVMSTRSKTPPTARVDRPCEPA